MEKQNIAIITNTSSGCNATALYRMMPPYIREKYNVRLIKERPYDTYDNDVKHSDVIVTTHSNYPKNNNQINVNLWHGLPIKGMANMDVRDVRQPDQVTFEWNNADVICSYSTLFNTVLNACIGTKIDKYKITGASRNDFLVDAAGKTNLNKLFNTRFDGKKVVFYMPTFREVFFNRNKIEGDKNWSNLFGFETFKEETFADFLKKSDIMLIVKLHPVEESIVIPHVNKLRNEGVYLLTNAMLEHENLDLYEVLNAADLLMTDYSSVYFDYLLLDRPIVFLPVDIEEYRKTRGFLLEPYDAWTPGPKVIDQSSMQEEIMKCIQDPNYYRKERESITRMAHQYTDNKSSERIWAMIDDLLDGRKTPMLPAEEIERLKSEIKSNIAMLIESGQLQQAKEIIAEYEVYSALDVEILTMKSVVLFSENESELAEEVLIRGYYLNKEYFDALYNLAIISESLGKQQWALYYYCKALKQCQSEELRGIIEQQVSALKNVLAFDGSVRKRVLIGSPVHQKPEILRQFLDSLEEVDKEKLQVDYFFVDDNVDSMSSQKIGEFERKHNVFAIRSNDKDVYVRDDNTHYWKEKLIWKVAGFKNDIIEFALYNDYDYLFLIDSDLVVHPDTLNQLIRAQKDIISNIFWTKWSQDSMELPQVWMKDSYTLYHHERNEAVSKEEAMKRTAEFLVQLKKPGVYQVGGLGACTMISRRALEKGVSFAEIKNISMQGEDRHFCIRAEALGLDLFVDTHYPAFHIYRESDLEHVRAYKEGWNLEK